MGAAVRAEDVMTPRTVLQFRERDVDAASLADSSGFDVVPISRPDGKILEFWSRLERRRIRIRRLHRASHDSPVEALLDPLGAHIVQFVYYRSEVVGLIDASDLNRPVARIAWLQPMLELERTILDAVRAHKIPDDEQAAALGPRARGARKLQSRAKRASLDLPLLDYVHFKDLLYAARVLGFIDLDDGLIDRLNHVRNHAAHSGDVVIEDRSDCSRLREMLSLARTVTRRARSLRRSQTGREPRET